MITIKTFLNVAEAQVIKTHLDAAGIDSFLMNETVVAANGLLANAVGGIELRVHKKDAKKAKEIVESSG